MYMCVRASQSVANGEIFSQITDIIMSRIFHLLTCDVLEAEY